MARPLPFFRCRNEGTLGPRKEAGMEESRLRRRWVELLALRALAGERVSLLMGRRRYTLTVDPIFRIEDAGDGFLYLCMGLSSLQQRLGALSGSGCAPEETVSELGGAQGSH